MSRRVRVGLVAALMVCLAGTACLGAQDHAPQPYNPDEFPSWSKELWRAEAVFVGSFPFTLFFTLEAYDTIRYASNHFSPGYAPFPFGTGIAASYSADETLWLAMSAVSLSMVIAGVDFLIGRASGRSQSR